MNRALVLLFAAIFFLPSASACKGKKRAAKQPEDGAPTAALHPNPKGDAGAGPAARRTPEKAVLVRALVKALDPERPRELYPRLLAQAIAKQLTESEWFLSTTEEFPGGFEPRRGELHVLITYDVLHDAKSKLRSIMAAVEAELVWEEEGSALPLREKVLFERTLAPEVRDDLDGLVATQVALAVEAVGAGLIKKEAVRSGPDERLAEALGGEDEDPELVLWALEIVREHKLAAMFDEVVALLSSKNPDLRETAVGVLLALGDRRAVEHLAEKAEMGDRDHLFAVIEAISVLGGEEAVDFLEFVGSGHPDGEVRDRARAGLERMKRATEGQ